MNALFSGVSCSFKDIFYLTQDYLLFNNKCRTFVYKCLLNLKQYKVSGNKTMLSAGFYSMFL